MTEEKARELELVRMATAGDKNAFRELFENYYSRAYGLAYGIMRNAEDAEEVLQEAFVKAYLGLKNFKGDSSFYTWLYRIVRNMAIDVKRKMARRIQSVSEEPDPDRSATEDGHLNYRAASPQEAYETKQELALAQRALNGLKEEQRTILMLREVDGLSYEEIAKVCGLNSGTVMSRLFYARKALKKILNDLEIEQEELENVNINKMPRYVAQT